MLLLPTGQVLSLVADGRRSYIDVEVFTSTGQPDPAWRPTISSVPSTLTRGSSFQISGTQFNGFSVGTDYGDDATMATNYPLVRLTNSATGHVFYARTHDHSTMAIATGDAIVSTMSESQCWLTESRPDQGWLRSNSRAAACCPHTVCNSRAPTMAAEFFRSPPSP